MNRTIIFKVSQLIQEDLLPSNKCQFKGFFEDFNDKMNTCGSTCEQLPVQSTKSDRQVSFTPYINSIRPASRTTEPQFFIRLGLPTSLPSHKALSYDKICRVKKNIINHTKLTLSKNNGIYILPNLIHGKPLFFAIDNIDLQIHMPDGKNQLHGTTQVVSS